MDIYGVENYEVFETESFMTSGSKSPFYFDCVQISKKSKYVFLLFHISSVIRWRGESQNGCFKKTKHGKFSKKRTFLTPLYVSEHFLPPYTHRCAYQEVRNVRFQENLTCFVFLKTRFEIRSFGLLPTILRIQNKIRRFKPEEKIIIIGPAGIMISLYMPVGISGSINNNLLWLKQTNWKQTNTNKINIKTDNLTRFNAEFASLCVKGKVCKIHSTENC